MDLFTFTFANVTPLRYGVVMSEWMHDMWWDCVDESDISEFFE